VLNQAPRCEVTWGNGITVHTSLTLILVEDELSTSKFKQFQCWERAPDTHYPGGWVDLRGGVEAVERLNLCPSPVVHTDSLF